MKVAPQKVVTVSYRLTDEAGELLDLVESSDPVIYLHGAGELIPGVENAFEGLEVDQEVEVDIDAENAFGDRQDDLQMVLPRGEFDEIELELGLELELQFDEVELVATVEEFNEETVTVDANHDLAGLNLHFSGKVLDIRDATADEIEHGHAHFDDKPCEE